jgi:hypothetical protein
VNTAELAGTVATILIGERRTPKPADTIFGQIDKETGATRLEKGNTKTYGKNSHASFGMYRSRGPVFRHNIENRLCYWWKSPSAMSKSCAEEALERIGYRVSGHRVMMWGGSDVLDAHGF